MRRCALTLPFILGCARPVSPPSSLQTSPLVASLRLKGLALRPPSTRPSPPAPSTTARPDREWARGAARPVPRALGHPEELRLLAGRLGAPPSDARSCAPVGSGEGARACLGGALGGPLAVATVIEQVARDRVVAVAAEEGFAGEAEAAARFAALERSLRKAHGAPEITGGELRWRAGGYEVLLGRSPGPAPAVGLILRSGGK